MMIPYSVWMLISGVILIILWMVLGISLGPGAPIDLDWPSGQP
jgi:aminobenzoyl-glutamate transport protein